MPWIEKIATQQQNDLTIKTMLAAARAGKLSDDLRRQIEPPQLDANSGRVHRGWVLLQQGSAERAQEAFAQVLAEDPDNFGAHNGMGFALLHAGKHAEARRHFEKCQALAPNSIGVMHGLALCLKAADEVDEAISLWTKILDMYPGPNAGTGGLVDVYLERGEDAKAIPLLEQLVEAQPSNAVLAQRLKGARDRVADAAR